MSLISDVTGSSYQSPKKLKGKKIKFIRTYFLISISKIADVLIYGFDYRYFTYFVQEFIRMFNLD